MLRSLYAGISGLKGFQTKLDVIGNNIANVNTTGYKKSRLEFSDILSQTTAGGAAPTATTAGTNPKQIGLGAGISSIDVIHTQGSLMTTNVPSDLAIQGNGFFMVSPSTTADDGAGTPANGKDFYLTRAGNFSVDAQGRFVTTNGMFVLNNAGQSINLLSLTGGTPPSDVTKAKVNSYSIAQDGSITVDWSDSDGNQGKIFSDPTKPDEKIAIGYVANPGGLTKQGNNVYQWSPSADTSDPNGTGQGTFGALAGEAGKAGRGDVIEGELEMSNTDLSEEFTEMIVAQRGFQANSRIITTSDSILQELVDLKRS